MFLLRLEGNNVKKENVTQKMFLLYVLIAPCAASIPAAHRNPTIGHVRVREERDRDELRRHRAAAPLRLRNTVKSVASQTTFVKACENSRCEERRCASPREAPPREPPRENKIKKSKREKN
ncbi:hypothetical protein PHAVU_009G193600 [Phaseolus vulgaris]|uniref:Uncharacterized protein n=1 Tax=Phaseolus vulgaris TaxID=3885 RepID=V7AXG1_PHAVU|nr:hypothetical protein PHAVU_009G193600g [Phaseolus vulgaris]ESW10254.1 hypothetical protein PHAVU_009G193600g [Phaseolus vulgaris]